MSPSSDSAYCAQTHISLLDASLASYHCEAGGTYVRNGAFISSKLATRGNRVLPPVFFTLVFQVGLFIQVLRLRHLRQGVHGYEFKIMIPQHLIVGGVVVDAGLDIQFAYINRHGNILLL